MNRKSEARKSETDHRLGFLPSLISPVAALIAVRSAALLTPLTAKTKISFGSEPWISRRMSWRKVIAADSSDQAARTVCRYARKAARAAHNANARRKKEMRRARRGADSACRNFHEGVE